MFRRILVLLLLVFAIFVGTYFGVLWLKDPEVDLTKYENVIPEYKKEIKELRVATTLVGGHFFGLRTQEGLERLEALTELESDIAAPAKKVLYYYYAQPERYKCEFIETCPEVHQHISFERSEKALYWARQMTGEQQTYALASLLRNTRIAPVATEADRIKLIVATEGNSDAAMNAASSLAFHYLDKRYFKNDMISESNLWLDRAAVIEQNL